jgi:hypothetical protein
VDTLEGVRKVALRRGCIDVVNKILKVVLPQPLSLLFDRVDAQVASQPVHLRYDRDAAFRALIASSVAYVVLPYRERSIPFGYF